MISASDRLFVLTGAGISVGSGLPAFRSPGGLWSGPIVEDVCTPDAWVANPWKVWEFYSRRREAVLSAEPNPAHAALAELEAGMGDRFFLCTQNVDNLHERAGSNRMIHLHGEILKSRCEKECGLEPLEDLRTYQSLSEVPQCACGALLRPHVVFFEEVPLELDRMFSELKLATILLVVGTSGTVQPAASLVDRAKKRKIKTVYVGLDKPRNAAKFSEIILGKAEEILPQLLMATSTKS